VHGFKTVAALGEARFGAAADQAEIDFRVVGLARGQADEQALEALGAVRGNTIARRRRRF
jgi:hypothetical protein